MQAKFPYDENIPGPYGQWGVCSIESRTIVHRNDPDTSHIAAEKVTQSGQRRSNNHAIAWLVARFPGRTASELSHAARSHYPWFLAMSADASLIETRRRLSDMNGIHVQRGTKDEARIGLLRNKESIWRPK